MKKKCKKMLTALLLTGAFFFASTGGFSIKTPAVFTTGVAESLNISWELMSAYTTYFNTNDRGRCENIRIAASLIDRITIQPYGEFSFNCTVGRRTAEAGFQSAKIIVNGEYVRGVGGGVCQVSTTLYNAALKSGLEAVEFHPHSLCVSYVPPSRDAMVSSESDLKLFNPHAFPVRVRTSVFEGGIKIAFWGKNDGYRYELSSNILETVPPPPPIVKTGDKDGILREAKDGVKSEMYLECYKGGSLLYKKRMRRDEYRGIQAIIAKKIEDRTN